MILSSDVEYLPLSLYLCVSFNKELKQIDIFLMISSDLIDIVADTTKSDKTITKTANLIISH